VCSPRDGVDGQGERPTGRATALCAQPGSAPRTFGAYEAHATSASLDEDPSPTVFAAKAAYEAAGIGPEDVDIAQLQDTDGGLIAKRRTDRRLRTASGA
jgi:hypothetical protein